jgi:probable HAF family extracellular repeat protein
MKILNAFWLLLLAPYAYANSYSFTPIDVPGGTAVFADGINNSGQIAGSFQVGGIPYGFVDTGGAITTINPPYGPLINSYTGIGINDYGQIVGEASIVNSSGMVVGSTGFEDSNGVFSTIVGPDGPVTQLFGINDHNQIIGFNSGTNGTVGFLDNNGVFTAIQDPNGTPGGASLPYAINNNGQIVGFFNEGAVTYGFLDTNGVFTTINDPAGFGTWATGINDNGEIVGFFEDASGIHGFVDNNGVFTTIDAPGTDSGTALYGINDSGELVGTSDSGSQSFLATPVPTPEPGSAVLLAIGVGVLFAMMTRHRRGRRHSQASQQVAGRERACSPKSA